MMATTWDWVTCPGCGSDNLDVEQINENLFSVMSVCCAVQWHLEEWEFDTEK
jgi:hypothetical protein